MFIRKEHKGIVDGKSVYESVEAGHGVTLAIGRKTYQVMSDIWEDGNYAIIWNEAEGRIQTVDWIESGVVDATEEVRRHAIAVERQKVFFRKLDELTAMAHFEARTLKRGCKAQVIKGRKVPIGTTGVVVGFSESQWGRKVGIATSDVMVEVQKGNRTFKNHRDVAWTAVGNVKRLDEDQVDANALREKAEEYANGHVARIAWAK